MPRKKKRNYEDIEIESVVIGEISDDLKVEVFLILLEGAKAKERDDKDDKLE